MHAEGTPLAAVLDKVRKLRRLSTSTNVHEAAAAAAAADRLIQEHRLEEAALEEAGGDADAPLEDPDPVLTFGRKRATWRRVLFVAVCSHYDCASYLARTASGGWLGKIVGRPTDILCVREVLAYLISEIDRLTDALMAGRGRTAHAAFRQGAAYGVWQALRASKAAAVAAVPVSTALVLASRKDLAEALLHRQHGDLRQEGPPSTPDDEAALQLGLEVGRAIDVAAGRARRLQQGTT